MRPRLDTVTKTHPAHSVGRGQSRSQAGIEAGPGGAVPPLGGRSCRAPGGARGAMGWRTWWCLASCRCRCRTPSTAPTAPCRFAGPSNGDGPVGNGDIFRKASAQLVKYVNSANGLLPGNFLKQDVVQRFLRLLSALQGNVPTTHHVLQAVSAPRSSPNDFNVH